MTEEEYAGLEPGDRVLIVRTDHHQWMLATPCGGTVIARSHDKPRIVQVKADGSETWYWFWRGELESVSQRTGFAMDHADAAMAIMALGLYGGSRQCEADNISQEDVEQLEERLKMWSNEAFPDRMQWAIGLTEEGGDV